MSDALSRAERAQRSAARQGFDWARLDDLWPKLEEEIAELRAVSRNRRRAEEELGDLLFMAVNLARHLKVAPGRALTRAIAKFARRYAYVMRHAAALPPPGSRRRLDAMEALWQKAKEKEKSVSRKGAKNAKER
jgi:uncharacterized protein YabN with tetrapyrrole methylase and pyrophosphatase domain